MAPAPNPPPRVAGTDAAFRIGAALALAWLSAAYALVLALGLLTLPDPAQPIQDPWFTAMELLILAIAPAMVAFTIALHGWVSPARRERALAAVVSMAICAALTCALHFAILALGRLPPFAGAPWAEAVFAFRWPSLAYAIDILAWDVFFALGALCAALALEGGGRVAAVRRLLLASAALAFAGLAGVPLGDMRVRNVGIVGYAVLFPLAAALMAGVFRREAAGLHRAAMARRAHSAPEE